MSGELESYLKGLDLNTPNAQEEKAMAPHSSILAWRIPWTEDPGRLQSMGSLRVGHRNFINWSCKLTLCQREQDGGGGQPPVKSEVRAQSSKVGRLCFFGGVDPGGLLRLKPAFAYAKPPSS